MARNINLNSSDWCDIVFEGKNKAYGAYEMRQTSSNRHLYALGVAFAFTVLIALIPSLIKAVTTKKDMLGGYNDTLTMSDITPLDEQKDEVIVEPTVAPPPPLVNSIRFTPPTIVDVSEVTPENQMESQEALRENTGIISTHTVVTDNTVGADIADVLRDQRNMIPQTTNNDPIDGFIEVMPEYPGGKAELARYLSSSIRYPTIAIENNIEGRVIVKFVVGKNGKISDVKVVRTLDPSCDKEAVRVVEAMPAWVPGRQNGNAVAVYFTLPIHFKLRK